MTAVCKSLTEGIEVFPLSTIKDASAKAMAGKTNLLEIIDYIDKKLEAYKKKYLRFKQKVIKDI